MRWLEPSWWRGMHRIRAVQAIPGREGAWYGLTVAFSRAEAKAEPLKTLGTTAELLTWLSQEDQVPVVLVPPAHAALHGFLEPEMAGQAAAALLGVAVDRQDDFCETVFPAAGGRTYAALLRRDAVDAWLEPLGAQAFRVIQVAYSPAMYAPLAMQAGAGNYRLNLPEGSLLLAAGLPTREADLAGQTWTEMDSRSLALTAGVVEEALPLFVCALHAWLQKGPAVGDHPATAEAFSTHLKMSRMRRIVSMGMVVVGLCALGLASARARLMQHKEELEAEYVTIQPFIEKKEELQNRVQAREALRESLGERTLKATRASFYVDRLAAEVPPGVALNALIVNPQEEDLKRIQIRDSVDFQLMLTGESVQSAPVSVYSDRLARLDWVGQVQVARSAYSFNNGLYEFVFLITLKDAGTES